MSDDITADAVVIGAGVIGAAVALELARGGRSVVCVDKGPAPGAGSTSASSSIIRFSYSTLDAVLTAWEAAACGATGPAHLGVDDPDGMARFVRTGNLIFCTPGYDGATIMALWDDVGIPYEWFDEHGPAAPLPGARLGRYFPPKPVDDPAFADDAGGELTAFFNADSGYIDDPMLAAHNLAHAARHHGAGFRFRRGRRRHRPAPTAGGRRRARRRRRDRRARRRQRRRAALGAASTRWPASPATCASATGRCARRCSSCRRRPGCGWRTASRSSPTSTSASTSAPRPAARCSSAGTEPECDELEWVDDPDHFDERRPSSAGSGRCCGWPGGSPTFGVPTRPVGLAALYDASDDWVPIYDRSSLDGWFMACGTSGNQFKNAPLAGQFMRALVDAAAAGVDHDVEPVQFRGAVTGRTIDLGAFSRRRDPAVTSGTVMG